MACNVLSYSSYGREFVEECFMYHLRDRMDAKHNFSVWFYPIYLLK